MRILRTALALISLFVLVGSVTAADPSLEGESLQCKVVPCTRKVFPNEIPSGETQEHLTAMVDEYVAFQIALRSVHSATLSVSTDLPDTKIFEALYVSTPGVAKWGYPEEFPEHRRTAYPDPLVPVEYLVLEPNQTKSLWVSIHARESVNGYVRLGEHEVTVNLEVLPMTIPVTPSLKASIGLGGKGFARCHGVEPYSEAYWEWYERYYRALLEYRVTATRVPRTLRDPSSRAILTDPRVTGFIAEYTSDRDSMRELRTFLESLGVLEKAWFYNIDEPEDVEQYENAQGQIGYLRKVWEGYRYALPFFVGAKDKSTPFDHLSEWVNLWVIQTDYYTHGHGLGDKVRRQARERWQAGDEIWVYTALAPRGGWCNVLLNHSALEHRLLFWQIYAEEILSGYLYWHSTYWELTDDPWTDQATVKNLDPCLWGDGSLFYPGEQEPVSSIRLHLIRAGLQDYELLKLAEAKVGRAAVMEQVRLLTGGFASYRNIVPLFEIIRREIQSLAR